MHVDMFTSSSLRTPYIHARLIWTQHQTNMDTTWGKCGHFTSSYLGFIGTRRTVPLTSNIYCGHVRMRIQFNDNDTKQVLSLQQCIDNVHAIEKRI